MTEAPKNPRWLKWAAIAALLWWLCLEVYGATVSIDNDSTDHDLRVIVYYEDSTTDNVTTPPLTVRVPPQASSVQYIPDGPALIFGQYANHGLENWGNQGTYGSDPHYPLTPSTHLFLNWGGGSPTFRVFEANAVPSGASSTDPWTPHILAVCVVILSAGAIALAKQYA